MSEPSSIDVLMAKSASRARETREQRLANRRGVCPPVTHERDPQPPTVPPASTIASKVRGIGQPPERDDAEFTPRQDIHRYHRQRSGLIRAIAAGERLFLNDPTDATVRDGLVDMRLELCELEATIGALHAVVVGIEKLREKLG